VLSIHCTTEVVAPLPLNMETSLKKFMRLYGRVPFQMKNWRLEPPSGVRQHQALVLGDCELRW